MQHDVLDFGASFKADPGVVVILNLQVYLRGFYFRKVEICC